MTEAAGKVGRIDRILRIVLGLVLLGFALICPFAQQLGPVVVWVSGVVGAIALITGLVGWCGLYRVLGIRT
jgi:hypothetical protein